MDVDAPEPDTIRHDEWLLARSWPAAETAARNGWVLRASGGATRRANSVLPLAFDGGSADSAVAAAESWYRGRGLAPCFMISPAALPPGLNATLTTRGYRREGDSLVMSAPLPSADGGAARSLRIADRPSPAWLDTAAEGRKGSERAAWSAIIRRTRTVGPAGFAEIAGNGMSLAAGAGVIVERTLCIFGMFTRPEARRAGLARRVLGGLIGWAAGADRILLQVEADNDPARRLYESFGLIVRYPYHYRSCGRGA